MHTNGVIANGAQAEFATHVGVVARADQQLADGEHAAEPGVGFPPPDPHADQVEAELISLREEVAAMRDRIARLRSEAEQAEHAEERQRAALREVVESTQTTLRAMELEHERALETIRLDAEREISRLRVERGPGSEAGATP